MINIIIWCRLIIKVKKKKHNEKQWPAFHATHATHTHKKKIENRVQNRQSKIFFLAENSKVTASGITQHEKKKRWREECWWWCNLSDFF